MLSPRTVKAKWIPAFAGMTEGYVFVVGNELRLTKNALPVR